MIPCPNVLQETNRLFPGLCQEPASSLPGLFADFNGFSIGAVFRNLLASLTNRRYSIFLSLPGLVIGIRLTIRANVLELNIIRTAAVNDKFGL